jgi:hypothetical protein
MKPKKPGDNISLKTKKNESPVIIEWINGQTNLMDSIRYLIENEVTANGVRNLQHHIPAQRALPAQLKPDPANQVESFKTKLKNVDIAAIEVAVTRSEIKQSTSDDKIDEEDIDSWL